MFRSATNTGDAVLLEVRIFYAQYIIMIMKMNCAFKGRQRYASELKSLKGINSFLF